MPNISFVCERIICRPFHFLLLYNYYIFYCVLNASCVRCSFIFEKYLILMIKYYSAYTIKSGVFASESFHHFLLFLSYEVAAIQFFYSFAFKFFFLFILDFHNFLFSMNLFLLLPSF